MFLTLESITTAQDSTSKNLSVYFRDYLQVVDGVRENGEEIEVVVHNHVGHVAVYEQLSGFQTLLIHTRDVHQAESESERSTRFGRWEHNRTDARSLKEMHLRHDKKMRRDTWQKQVAEDLVYRRDETQREVGRGAKFNEDAAHNAGFVRSIFDAEGRGQPARQHQPKGYPEA